MKKLNLAIVFGAKSPEHDVSIVTTLQAWEWIDPQKYNRWLIYLDTENHCYLCPTPKKEEYRQFIGKTLKRKVGVNFIKKGIEIRRGIFKQKVNLDCAFLIMHGSYGEDGRIQGMLDFFDIPYTGSGVLGSALGMDKVVMKDVFVRLGLPITPYLWFWDEEFETNSRQISAKIEKSLKYPLFIKPANAGSSVGISKIKNKKGLKKAVKLASQFDHKILVEEGVKGAVDINCAIMGGYQPIASVCEQPIIEDKFFSFQEKYLKGGKKKGMASLNRIMPAPLPQKVTKQIQATSIAIFKELGCWGMARMDFLYQEKTKTAYANEINTIPGSLAFYLWEASGIKPRQLIDRMIKLALERKKELSQLNYSFKSPLLDQK